MPTVKKLHEQAKSYGLRGYSTLRKPGLIWLIAKPRTPVFRERLKCAVKTGRYPVLRGDIDNPHKKAQRIRELHQFKDEVTAALRVQKYEQESKSDPLKRLKMHNKAYKRVMTDVCRMPEIISEIGDMEYKHLISSVHRVVSLIKVLNQNPQFQHLIT